MARFADTNIILTGGVDDIWRNTKNGKLVVTDYKSQANTKSLDPETYPSDACKKGYKVQMDFYFSNRSSRYPIFTVTICLDSI